MPSSAIRLAFLLLLAPLLLSAAAKPIRGFHPKPNSAATTTAAAAPPPPPVAPVNNAAKLQPRAPQPTKRMGQRRAVKSAPQKKDYSSFLCPGGSVACPVPDGTLDAEDIDEFGRTKKRSAEALESSLTSLADWFRVGFECIELDIEPNSCGGCLALGAGQDCSLIPQAKTTGCQDSQCLVYTCTEGYVVGPDRKSCVVKGTVQAAIPITAQQNQAGVQVPIGK